MVWHFSRDSDNPEWRSILQKLADSGLRTAPLKTEAPQGPRIAFLSTVDEEDLEAVQGLSHGGINRVLVILGAQLAKAAEAAWRLLASGASDVLQWNAEGPAIAAARIARWTEIDLILGTDLVAANLVGRSPAWIAMLRDVIEVARFTSVPVLLIGESGTGKELIARLIHTLDVRANKKALVVADCTTIVPELAGSEFFGHERGAFTNALQARDGAFALADGGTLFLDEVGELQSALQAQLLRVVQEKTYKRVGSNQWHHTNFRLICATNRDLRAEVENGSFRRDLYHRLASWTVLVPPLRERDEDVLLLAKHFLSDIQPNPPVFDDAVSRFLLARSYDGNVRELRQLMTRIAARHVGPGRVSIGDIPEDERPSSVPVLRAGVIDLQSAIRGLLVRGASLKEISREASSAAVRVSLEACQGNLQLAARMLKVTDRALQIRASRGEVLPSTTPTGEPVPIPAAILDKRSRNADLLCLDRKKNGRSATPIRSSGEATGENIISTVFGVVPGSDRRDGMRLSGGRVR